MTDNSSSNQQPSNGVPDVDALLPQPAQSGQVVNPSAAVVEQYKAKLADLGNLGTRLTASTTYYVSIISAFLGVLAFKDRALSEIDAFVVLIVGVGGILVSLLWYFGISFFRSLFRAKLQQIERIEEALPFQTFRAEFEVLRAAGNKGWLRVERYVPLTFCFLFILILAARFLPRCICFWGG